jgi:hypothetical protein
MAFISTSKLISTLLLLVSFTSKAAGQNCSLCPDGSSIEDAAREFLGLATCGDSEDMLSDLSPGAECDGFVDTINAASYNQTAFCCSDMDPAKGLCSLCEAGSSLINPDSIVLNGPTCSELSTDAAYIVDATVCEQFTSVRPFCCSQTTNTCPLCPNGGEIAFPDKAVPFLEGWGVSTCAGLYYGLTILSDAECDSTLADLGAVLSYQAWCGCTDVTTPEICDFCGSGELVDPNQVIPETDGGTCEQFDELSPYLTSMETCADIQGGGRPLCCTNPDPTCAICPDGSPVGLPDRKVYFSDGNFTCGDFDKFISFVPEDECADELASLEVNYASWCGCAGVETPDECFLCGPDEEISDPAAIIPERDGLTCEVGAELARHVVNETSCEIDVKPNVDFCCRAKTTAPTAESSTVPTAAPTAESSAPASKFVVALTSGMLMVGTMMLV